MTKNVGNWIGGAIGVSIAVILKLGFIGAFVLGFLGMVVIGSLISVLLVTGKQNVKNNKKKERSS